jgi:hypothetical protein
MKYDYLHIHKHLKKENPIISKVVYNYKKLDNFLIIVLILCKPYLLKIKYNICLKLF